jgi:two-component system chemotaxis response regulator CheB
MPDLSPTGPHPPVRVLVADDSAVVRELVRGMLESDPSIRVVGMAADGGEAVSMTADLHPDIVTMDLVMPKMDGMEATERIMASNPTPVLFLSSYFGIAGMYSRNDALAAGALDIVAKPTAVPDERWDGMARALVEKVKVLAQVPVVTHMKGARRQATAIAGRRASDGQPPPIEVVGIGGSSGGARVLEALLAPLPSTYSLGIIVVQHMADGFMPALLQSLQMRCELSLRIAQEGDPVLPRRVLFTPDGAHLIVQPNGRVHLSYADPISGHRPSVDATMTSLARTYGPRAAGVLLTGMGSDGAAGLLAIRHAGGATMVQDQDSCVVFGMPRAAIALGAAEHVLPPAGILRRLKALHSARMRFLTR